MEGVSSVYLLRPRFLGLRNRWRTADKRMQWIVGAFGFGGVLFWVGLLVGLAYLVGAFQEVEVFGPLLTRKLLEILLVSLFAMLIFSNVITTLSNFYLSDDLELVLSFPVARGSFHYARLAESMTQSSWMMAMFGMPLFLAYGYVHGAGLAYYALLLVVVPAFLLIPAAIGVSFASILVNVFPARRAREALVVMGLLLVVAVFLFLRLVRPEQLVNAQAFESLAAYVAELQSPIPDFFPPRWAGDVLISELQGRPFPVLSLGLLVSGAGAALAGSRWLVMSLFDGGWSKSQEAGDARFATAGWLDGILSVVRRVLPADMGPVVTKDVKVFFRDPSQWSQVFLLGSLIMIYLFSVQALPVDVVRGPFMQGFKNALAFLNLGMAGFVMAGIAVRFQFTAVSGEGRAFWILRSGPVKAERYLLAKALPGMLPMLVVGETLILASNSILDSPLSLSLIGGLTALLLAFSLSGLAMGLGASFPDFKADNAAKASAGLGGLLFMVLGLVLVGVVIGLEAPVVWFILRAGFEERALSVGEIQISAVLITVVCAICIAVTIVPIRKAARGLWERAI